MSRGIPHAWLCAEKYGADWDTYIRRVPYVFVPGLV